MVNNDTVFLYLGCSVYFVPIGVGCVLLKCSYLLAFSIKERVIYVCSTPS